MSEDESVQEAFNLINEQVEEETGEKFHHLEKASELYGVRRCLSTGLPSLNLLCMEAQDGNFGIPYGRFTEIHGESKSAKTSHGYELCGRNLNHGGMSFYMTSEMDVDKKYTKERIRSAVKQYTFNEDNLEKFGVKPIRHIGDMYRTFRGIVKVVSGLAESIRDEGGDPLADLPPIVVVVDSLGALMGEENRERVREEDKNKRQGSHADELHDFFKSFVYDVARYGICWVGMNHFRANMDMFGSDYNAAYDDAIKYYCSLRLKYKGLSETNLDNVEVDGKEFSKGFPVKIESYKVRDEVTLEGKTKIDWFHNHGFDYLGSLGDACEWTDVFEKVRRSWKIDVDRVENQDLVDFIEDELDGKAKHSQKNWKKIIRDNPEVAAWLEQECYREGVPTHDEIITI